MSIVQNQVKAMTPGRGSSATPDPGNFSGNYIKKPLTNSADTLAIMNSQSNNEAQPSADDQRVDLAALIEELTGYIGKENWIRYAQVISLFILGKLSRRELTSELDAIFNLSESQAAGDSMSYGDQSSAASSYPILVRLHNHILLGIMTNSLRDNPLGKSSTDGTWGFRNENSSGNARNKRVNKHSSQIEMYKKIVMSLPANDRTRLKSITKEAGKRGFVFCSVLQARLKNIPKIPIVTQPETLKRVKNNNLKTPLEWSQDIVNGFNAPLATECFSLPDTDSIYLRMVAIAREHGLVGTVDATCVGIISVALENYLKNIVEKAIDTVRYRRKRYSEYYDLNDEGIYTAVAHESNDSLDEVYGDAVHELISLTNEDLHDTISIFPNIVEPSGAQYNLMNLGLSNDDELVIKDSRISDMPEFDGEAPSFTPLDDKNIGTRDELLWLIKDILAND